MTLKLNGLWRLCSIYRASLASTLGAFSVSVCFTGRLWAGGQRRPVNIAGAAIWTPSAFSVSVCFAGRLWAGGQRRLVIIAETAIRLQPEWAAVVDVRSLVQWQFEWPTVSTQHTAASGTSILS